MAGVGTSAFDTAGTAMDLVRALINDAGIAVSSNIVTATRAGNIVTVVTQQNHGLQLNDHAVISLLPDVTFNGAQTVFAVLSPTQFQYANVGANGNTGPGICTQVLSGDVFTDVVLYPHVNVAYRKVQRRIRIEGDPALISQIDLLNVAATTGTSISDTTAPQLPVDLVFPRTLFERVSGSSQRFQPMRQTQTIPDVTQTGVLGVWAWREETIQLLGATQATDVRVRYSRSLQTLTDRSSQLLIRDILDPVAFYTAALAVNSKDGDGSGFVALYNEAMKEVQRQMNILQQYRPARRRGYPAGLRRRYDY